MSEKTQFRLNTPITVESDVLRIDRIEADSEGVTLHYKIGAIEAGNFVMREYASVRVPKSVLSADQELARKELIEAYDLVIAQAGLSEGIKEPEVKQS